MPTLCTGPLSRPELLRRVGRLEQVGGVRLVELADGDGRGVRVLEFRTGSGFAFDILVDRTFDVWRCELNGIPLAWTSPVGVRRAVVLRASRLRWSRTFAGGLVVTCGLDHAQVRARTRQRSTTAPLPPDAGVRPPRARGRASREARGIWRALGGRRMHLWAEGEVLQGAVFEEHLLLHRRSKRRWADRRSDSRHGRERGSCADPAHVHLPCNIGWPIVDEGSEIVVPARAWSSTYPAAVTDYRRLTAPQRGSRACYEHEMVADEPAG